MVEIISTAGLTERRRHLLNIVIQEYIHTAQPVGSSNIVRQHDLGVSSATIRNDLAALEKEGLLTHPHTSAGRVPTDAGYRYFAQQVLATDTELPSAERQEIRVQFKQARRDMDQWLRLSTATLAHASQNAALATAPRAVKSSFKHMELVGIQGTKVLLVLVLQDGTVKQQLLDLDEPMEQSELSQISNELNDQLARADSKRITEHYPSLTPFSRQVAMLVAETMERIDSNVNGQIYRDAWCRCYVHPNLPKVTMCARLSRFLSSDHCWSKFLANIQGWTKFALSLRVMGDLPNYRTLVLCLAGTALPIMRQGCWV